MSTAQKIWDSAHHVRIGQTLHPGTEFVRVADRDHHGRIKEIGIHTVEEGELLEITNTYMVQFIRTTERQTDRIDTGTLGFQLLSDDKIEIRTRSRGVYTTFTRTQARNFAHQILEALDG